MKIHIKSLDDIKDRIKIYRPMALYQGVMPAPIHQCRCAPLYTDDSHTIYWWDNDGHIIECVLDESLDMTCLNGRKVYINSVSSIYVWDDKYTIDELFEKCIRIEPAEDFGETY